MLSLVGVFFAIVVHVLGDVKNNNPTVNIKSGTVIGSVAFDGDYFEFLGIPYADSTAGSHRFKAPLPPPTFVEPFIANRRDVKCVRAQGKSYEGIEDCLVANVFTPTLNATQNLPVMVWLKGREFDRINKKDLSFKNFIDQDVIVVTLNYRESIFGFLCLGTETAPGNAGLKDVVFGLKWVQQNIKQFGGNPDDITLIGHGSGAAAVDLVTLSPMAKGLVHKVIAQSGNALAPWVVSHDNIHYAVTVAEALGQTITTIEDLSEIFTRASIPALMDVINELDLTNLAFSPCVERKNFADIVPFLDKSPFQIISNGEFLKIPFITGFVDKKRTITGEKIIEAEWINRMENSFSEFLQTDLQFQTDEERNQVNQNIRTYYFQNETVSLNTLKNYFTYHGDTMILSSAIREIRLRANEPSAPVYLHQFTYEGGENVAHNEELIYLFKNTSATTEESEISQMDLTVAKILIERWTNFAKKGEPVSEISEIEWRPFTLEHPYYLRFLDDDEVSEETGETVEIVKPHPGLLSLWNEIFEEHFLNAESRPESTARDDELEVETPEGDNDDSLIDEGAGEEDEGNGEEVEGSGEVDDGIDDEVEGSGETDNDNESDSASTAVGYTFLIISLFAVLDKFHSSQILCL